MKDAQRHMRHLDREERLQRRKQIIEQIQRNLADLTSYLDDLHIVDHRLTPSDEEWSKLRQEVSRLKREREQQQECSEKGVAVWSARVDALDKANTELKKINARLSEEVAALRPALQEQLQKSVPAIDAVELSRLTDALKGARLQYDQLKEESLRRSRSMKELLDATQEECNEWKKRAMKNVDAATLENAKWEASETKRQYNDIHRAWSDVYRAKIVATPPPPHYLKEKK